MPSQSTSKETVNRVGLDRLLNLAGDLLDDVLSERKDKRDAQGASVARIAADGHAMGITPTPHDRERENDVNDRPLDPNSLVGSWFHKLENDRPVWQGCVVAEIQPGVYMVEVHSWGDGSSSHQQTVSMMELIGDEPEWRFYDSSDWMRKAYEEIMAEARL